MRKLTSLIVTVVLLLSLAPASLAEDTSYIAAPYAIDEAMAGPTEYLDPVFYENEGGPTIGVTLVGVIVQDGLYFKDSDNDQELDAFEDWRLDVAARVADLLPKLTMEQRAGLLANEMRSSPKATNYADVVDESGNVILSQLLTLTEGDVFSKEHVENGSTGAMLGNELRSGVIRSNTEAQVGAVFNNAGNMVSEYGAVAKKQPAIPYTMFSNPMNAGYPNNMGMSAAVMGEGNYDSILKYADMDRQIWNAKGIDSMYGPQIDLITDPRWNRNSGTYTEVPEVMAGIAEALVRGYQTGDDGAQDGDVIMMMKHFPGDGAAENGFESHNAIGQWRIYATEGSLEKYHLPGFQAAIDAGMGAVMPGYSRPTLDARSVPQSYRGVEIPVVELGNAYSTVILQTLLKDLMGFDGFVNTDSGIIVGKAFGVDEEATTLAERFAMIINAGSDTGANGTEYAALHEAVLTGLIEPEALDRATTNRMTAAMNMSQFENPYRDPEVSKATADSLADEIAALQAELNRKSVVLMKNSGNALPLTDTSKSVYILSFTHEGRNEDTENGLKEAFEAAGFTVVDKAEEADIAYLAVAPGGVSNSNNIMNVIDLVEDLEVEERSHPDSQAKSGTTKKHTTLMDVAKVPEIAEAVHANGGIVVASIRISSPWILTNLEPYVDALIGEFSSPVPPLMDVITGAFNPTGKLPITMVSCNEVIAVNEVEIDGVVYEICVSPNDVPGYAKDEYMSAEVLAQSPSGSYAYQDTDGNVYAAWFGLSY